MSSRQIAIRLTLVVGFFFLAGVAQLAFQWKVVSVILGAMAANVGLFTAYLLREIGEPDK
jgi:membrane associated rhomboid family serine protease